ncbi:MAG: TRAP transporter substrate-binding protein [Candidatus Methylomirabilales bacterium]
MRRTACSVAMLGLVLALAAMGAPRTAAAAAPVVKMTIPSHVLSTYQDMYPPIKQFVDRLNELGKGKIQAGLYHSESLYKVKDIVPALMNGSCEIIFHTSSHTTGAWAEIGGLNLPFLYKSNEDVVERWKQGGELLDLVNREMDRKYGVRILGAGITGSLWFWTIDKKPVTKPADLKGLKIRTTGKVDAELVKAAGGSPIFLSSAESYEALQRGTIEGLTTFPGGLPGRNFDEVVRYGLNTGSPMSAWAYQIYVRTRTFGGWPKEVQDAVLTAAREYDQAIFKSMMKYEQETVFPRIAKRVKLLVPTADDLKKFQEVGALTYPIWLKSVDRTFGEKFIELSRK